MWLGSLLSGLCKVTEGPPADHLCGASAPGLTAFQMTVARLFFSLKSSAGFLLAGGAGLLAQELTDRPTHDLDLFTALPFGHVAAARNEFEDTAAARGWKVQRVRDSETFCRLLVSGEGEDLLIDLALDAPPGRPARTSIVGPTFDPEELAGRKVIALFDRAEARDFVDVYLLAQRFPKDVLLARAAEIDPGFDRKIFADMLASLSRFSGEDLPLSGARLAPLRTFFAAWRTELGG